MQSDTRQLSDLPKEKLCELIDAHGIRTYQDPNWLHNMLRDACENTYVKEIRLLIAVVTHDIAAELDAEKDNLTVSYKLLPFATKLEAHGYNKSEALWAVNAWATGLSGNSALTSAKTIPARPGSKSAALVTGITRTTITDLNEGFQSKISDVSGTTEEALADARTLVEWVDHETLAVATLTGQHTTQFVDYTGRQLRKGLNILVRNGLPGFIYGVVITTVLALPLLLLGLVDFLGALFILLTGILVGGIGWSIGNRQGDGFRGSITGTGLSLVGGIIPGGVGAAAGTLTGSLLVSIGLGAAALGGIAYLATRRPFSGMTGILVGGTVGCLGGILAHPVAAAVAGVILINALWIRMYVIESQRIVNPSSK